ncbi:MerR family DNA-binding transcriptional regulator [Castellaniella sp.]|uniref:MerR family transcriptional regulator n=1 Tax=Castellaniella sp. TaxID=1955812 RepID=UPI002AFDD854|nr:MerR family DNA-binding transcriptional regulator [Castellaniella sp.]
MRHPTWTISELSREFGITPRTIRFYEDQGIVSPAREGRNRVYATRDRTRLKLALRGRRLGLQLAEIVTLINLYDRSHASTTAQLQHYAQVLDNHRQKLEQQRHDLDETLEELHRQQAECVALLRSRQAADLAAVHHPVSDALPVFAK